MRGGYRRAMISVPSFSTMLIWLMPLLVAVALVWLWRPQVPMSDALDLLNNAVAEERNPAEQAALARAALEALADDVDPVEALRQLRRFLPAASGGQLRNMLVDWWQERRRPPVLAALAGLSQEMQPNGRVGLGLETVLRDAGSGLLSHVASGMERDFAALDELFGTGGILILLEAAAKRVDDPALATRLQSLAKRVAVRTPEVMLTRMRRLFAEVEADEEDGSPHGLAIMLRALCMPRFPELMLEAQALFALHRETAWRLAAMELDVMVIEQFGASGQLDGLDFDAVRQRLRDGLVAHDEEVSAAAAEIVLQLVALGHLGAPDDLLVFQDAMDWTANLHWPRPPSHLRLLALLEQHGLPGER